MNTQKQKQSLEVPKSIILTGKIIQFFSKDLATKFAQNLFITPIKFKAPKREKEMIDKSIITTITVKSLQKDITVYQYGTNKQANKKALLIHGWNGRGTQLVTIANMLTRQGYDVVAFDAPGHGKSPSTKTNLAEFIQSSLEVQQQFGPFDLVVGHSLGGMTTINALARGLKAKMAIIIGSGDVVEDVVDDFIKQIELKPEIATKLKQKFESQFNQSMQDYCVHLHAKNIDIPLLIIHDTEDFDVPIKAAYQIKKHNPKAKLIVTKDLGHRKILGDRKVIEQMMDFIKSHHD